MVVLFAVFRYRSSYEDWVDGGRMYNPINLDDTCSAVAKQSTATDFITARNIHLLNKHQIMTNSLEDIRGDS